jgi:hypothetical protein
VKEPNVAPHSGIDIFLNKQFFMSVETDQDAVDASQAILVEDKPPTVTSRFTNSRGPGV